jgi:hypothetical protein
MFVHRIVWLTFEDHTYVDFIRNGLRRKSEERNKHPQLAAANRGAQGKAKSVFRFGVQGSVAKSTPLGIPWHSGRQWS